MCLQIMIRRYIGNTVETMWHGVVRIGQAGLGHDGAILMIGNAIVMVVNIPIGILIGIVVLVGIFVDTIPDQKIVVMEIIVVIGIVAIIVEAVQVINHILVPVGQVPDGGNIVVWQHGHFLHGHQICLLILEKIGEWPLIQD